jgi:hypothetical protein
VKTPSRIPGLLPAIGAFVLTVLLGAGGTAASALWQQSATATMTVTADSTASGPSFGVTCTDPTKKSVALAVSLSSPLTANKWPVQLTVGVINASSTYSEWQITAPETAGTINLTTGHAIFVGQPSGLLNIRITATYADWSSATLERQIRKGNGNSEITCS